MRSLIKNKRGQESNIIILFVVIFILLVLGFCVILLSSIISDVGGEILPALRVNVGEIGNVNASQVANPILSPFEIFLNSFSWLWGVLFMLGIFLLFGLAVAFRMTSNKWLLGIWFVFTILLILFSILISNVVEDFANSGDSIGAGIQNQTLLYFLLLNSPIIFTIISFVCMIIIFSGLGGQDEFL